MRLIDADAFKDYYRNAYEQVKHTYADGGEWAKGITEELCKDIDKQPTIAQQEWIPVSERFPDFRHVINPDPEEDGEWDESPFVLVCFDDGDIECRQFVREDGEVFVYPEEFRGRKPVAWQPLPDPWKEEE